MKYFIGWIHNIIKKCPYFIRKFFWTRNSIRIFSIKNREHTGLTIKEYNEVINRIKKFGLTNKEFDESMERIKEITESAKKLGKS